MVSALSLHLLERQVSVRDAVGRYIQPTSLLRLLLVQSAHAADVPGRCSGRSYHTEEMMRKKDELSLEHTCMQHAHPEEMVFVLLGRDPAAPIAIRTWAAERLRLGKNVWADAQIVEAIECAATMEHEGRKWVDAPIKRPPGCKCHLEEGDSPCPVHGEEAVTSTGHAKAIQEIDAALFNGKTFNDPAVRAVLSAYVERGARELRERP